MTFAFDVTEAAKKDLVAALHPADFTTRAHIVSESINPDYYKLIKAFEQETGIGAVLNTSFNLHGYPIVCSPNQAVHVFTNSDLDGMILEDMDVILLFVKVKNLPSFPEERATSLSQKISCCEKARLQRVKNTRVIKKSFFIMSLFLSLLFTAAFVGIGFLTMEPLFRALGASDEVLPYVKELGVKS